MHASLSRRLAAAGLALAAITGVSAAAGPSATAAITWGCKYTSSQPTLYLWVNSPTAVKQLQCELNAAKANNTYLPYNKVAVDGIFGYGTQSAVVAFQRWAGIAKDGVVGPVTWSNINYYAMYCVA